MAPPERLRAGAPATFALVAAGGAAGGVLRYVVAGLLGDGVVAVMVVNLVGCFALGALLAGPVAHGSPAWVRPTLGTGLLGGFTTFSAVSWAAATLPPTQAGMVVSAQLVAGVATAALGVLAGTAWAVRRGAPTTGGRAR